MLPFPPPLPLDDARPRRLRVLAHAKTADDALAVAAEALRERGHRVEVRVSDAPGRTVRLAEEAARDGVDTVVAAGGDGTLNEVVNGLARAGLPVRPTVAVLPGGSANDFAAAAGLPLRDPEAALRLALTAPPVPIDLGRLDDTLFVNAASGGFGAELTVRTSAELKQWFGGGAYLLTGLTSPEAVRPKFVRLRGNGFSWSGELYVLAVGNGRQMGGGFRLCPQALVNDGLLDACVVPAGDPTGLLGLLHDLLVAGSPRDYEAWVYRPFTWLEVEAPDELQVNLDGEPRRGTAFRFEVVPRALRLHLPPDSPLLSGTGEEGQR